MKKHQICTFYNRSKLLIQKYTFKNDDPNFSLYDIFSQCSKTEVLILPRKKWESKFLWKFSFSFFLFSVSSFVIFFSFSFPFKNFFKYSLLLRVSQLFFTISLFLSVSLFSTPPFIKAPTVARLNRFPLELKQIGLDFIIPFTLYAKLLGSLFEV